MNKMNRQCWNCTEQKTDQINRIVEIIRNNPSVSRSELAKELHIHENSVKRRLEFLVKSNRIKRAGADNGGSREIID